MDKTLLDKTLYWIQNIFGPKCFWTKYFLDQTYFLSKYFFWPKTFSDKNFCLPNFFWPKFFSTKIWFSPKFFEILNFGLVWATLVRYSFIRFNFDFHNRSKYVYVIIYQELNLASIVRLTPAQLQLLLVKPFISSSSRLTVSAWVSPSSTPACN